MDLISLGLDVSSFTQQKMDILQECIRLFNELAKHDGKVYNPIMGDGIASFNKSLHETNTLLTEITTRLEKLSNVNSTLSISVKNVASNTAQVTSGNQAAAASANQSTQAINNNTTSISNNIGANKALLEQLKKRRDELSNLGRSLTIDEGKEFLTLGDRIEEATAAAKEEQKEMELLAQKNIRAAEAATKLAEAETKKSKELVAVTKSNVDTNVDYVRAAQGTEEINVANQGLQVAEQEALAAAITHRVIAERQLVSANNQLAVAEDTLANAGEISARQQKILEDAVNRGRIAVKNAEAQVLSSERNLNGMASAMLKVQRGADNINNKKIDDLAASNIKAAESATKLAEAESKRSKAFLDDQKSTLLRNKEEARISTGDDKIAAKQKVETASTMATAAALEHRKNVELQLAAAHKQLEVAERMVENATKGTVKQQREAAAAYSRASVAVKNGQTALLSADKAINQISVTSMRAENDGKRFGHALGGIYQKLLLFAYIVPGLGVAGLFNAMFDALGNVAKSILEIDQNLATISEREKKFNDILKEQISLYKEIVSQREKLISLTDSSPDSLRNLEFQSDVNEARGVDDLKKLQTRYEIAVKSAEDARGKIPADILSKVERKLGKGDGETFESLIVKESNRLTKKQNDLKKQLEKIESLANISKDKPFGDKVLELSSLIFGTPLDAVFSDKNYLELMRVRVQELRKQKVTFGADGKPQTYAEDDYKAVVDEIKSRLELYKTENNGRLDLLQDYFDKKDAVTVANETKVKKFRDEERAYNVQTQKADLELYIKNQQKIVDSAITGEKTKLAALDNIRNAQKKIADRDYYNVAANESETPQRKAIAKKIYDNAVGVDGKQGSIDMDYWKKRLDMQEEYRQRRISSIAKMQEEELELNIKINSAIYKDDNQSLEKRLEAYDQYVQDKQKMEQIQYEKDIDKLSLKAKGPDGRLDPTVILEIGAREKQRETEKLEAQANVEREVYDITKTSLDKRLQLVIDENNKEDFQNKVKYKNDLKEQNDNFDNKKVSYKKYREEIKKIQDKYEESEFDEKIQDDLRDIGRLDVENQKLVEEKKKVDEEVDDASVKLKYAQDNGLNTDYEQKRYDTAIGRQKALNKKLMDLEKERQRAMDQLKDDELKKELARIKKLEEAEIRKMERRSAILDAIADIERALYEMIKSITDRQYENRMAQIEKEREATAEMYDHEIEAVANSTLSLKDKQAIEIQLQAQKMQKDKNFQAEQKRLSIEHAQFEKKLAIAHIAIQTAVNVANAWRDPIKGPIQAIAAGIVGAIQIATVAATPIPNYAKGTDYHPGGTARFGEAGAEVVTEPGKKPYLVTKETISYLPRGTEVVPIKESPVFQQRIAEDSSWEQTMFLAKAMKNNKQKTFVNNQINIDLGFENYKKEKLYGV